MFKTIRRFAPLLGFVAALGLAGTAQATVEFVNLGYGAPPASVGGIAVTPFDLAPQAAINDTNVVGTIPGSPVPGDLTVAPDVEKRTMPDTWGTVWSNGYTGPVFWSGDSQNSLTLTLPPQTTAFYFHVQPNEYSTFIFTATTDSGATSGPVQITGAPTTVSNVPGLAFHATDPGEYISTIQISADTSRGFAMAQFGIASDAPPAPLAAPVAVPTLGQWSLLLLGLLAAGLGARRLRRQG